MLNKFEASKSWFWLILDAALLAVLVLAVLSSKALLDYGHSLQPAQTITVSADSKASIVPDLATLNFSVVSEGTDTVKLQTDNNNKINDAIAYLKTQSIDSKDIKTSGYNLNPKYVYNPKTGQNYISGYTMTQTVTVKIRDFAKISPILAALPEKGINSINGPSFSVEDQDKYLNQARAEAFAKAKAKAQAMADYAGAHLGRVVTFNENGGGYPIYYDRMETMSAKGGVAAPVPAPTIEPGSQDVTVTVNVTYEIR